MDNALENENLDYQGEVNDNVGQDEGKQAEESGDDWQSQAKYFQSEKDKLYAENQNLKKYEQLGQMLESRPDIVETISGMVQGQPTPTEQRINLEKDEFDPWKPIMTRNLSRINIDNKSCKTLLIKPLKAK